MPSATFSRQNREKSLSGLLCGGNFSYCWRVQLMWMKKKLKWIFAALVAVFALLQLANPPRTNPPVAPGHDLMATNPPPPEIAALLHPRVTIVIPTKPNGRGTATSRRCRGWWRTMSRAGASG